jgi:ParB/RepB/Spo0J family partition protein
MPSKPKDFLGALNKTRGVLTQPTSETGRSQPESEGAILRKRGILGGGKNPFQAELEQQADQLPIIEIEIDQLLDNPYQYLARSELNQEALEELAASIQQNGFYGALLARRKQKSLQVGLNQQYELAYGHRRRGAARLAGLTTLPVKIVELSDQQMTRIMASENFSREDLTPLGEANVVGYLSTTQNLSIEEIAEIIGKKRGWIAPRLALYQAPTDIKNMVEQRPDTLSYVSRLSQFSPTQREELIQKILEGKLTRDQLQNLINSRKQASEPTFPSKAEVVPVLAREKIDEKITSVRRAEDSDKAHKDTHKEERIGIASLFGMEVDKPTRSGSERAEMIQAIDFNYDSLTEEEKEPSSDSKAIVRLDNVENIKTSIRLDQILNRLQLATTELEQIVSEKDQATLEPDKQTALQAVANRLLNILSNM